MALTQRFFNPAASGANNGTSEANGWETLADLAAGYAAGQVIECLQPDSGSRYQEGGAADLATPATLTAPILLRGYTSTPGDGGICFLDMEANELAVSGSQITLTGFDIIGSNANRVMKINGQASSLRRSKIVNSGSGANTYSALNAPGGSIVLGCYLEAQNTNAAARVVNLSFGSQVFGSYIKSTAGTSGNLLDIRAYSRAATVSHCVLDGGAGGCAAAIENPRLDSFGYFLVANNTIYKAVIALLLSDLPAATSEEVSILIANNLLYAVTNGIVNPAGTPTNSYPVVSNNAIGAVTTPYDLGDTPICDAVTLTADPFRDKANGDFRLNSAAGGGALCRGAGIGADLLMDGSDMGFLSIGGVMAKGGGGDRRMVIGQM